MAPKKPLSFTKHAADVVRERKIERQWVERAVLEPDWSIPDPKWPGAERRYRAIAENGGRVLRVACLETASEVRILTAFFDRNAKDPR